MAFHRAPGVLLVLLLLIGLLGCGSEEKQPLYRIGFSQCSMAGPWRQAMLAGMQKELSFHPEIELRVLDAQDDSRRQQAQIRELVQGGVDLLIISPYEADPVTPAVEEAYRRGIPVILLDRRTASDQYTAYVGGNNVEVGQTAARYISRVLRQRGNILEILGTPGSSATAERHQGFAQGLSAYPGLQVVAQVTGDWTVRTLKPALTKALQAHPEVTMIFSHNDGMGHGAYEVCQELGLTKRVRIIGVDGLPGAGEGIDLVQRGVLAASILYSPGGEEAIRTALKILHKAPFNKQNTLGTIVIDSTNVLTLQQQNDKMASQQQDIERQQGLLHRLQQTYASQQVVLNWLLITLLGAVALGAAAWHSARKNRQINHLLALQNAENDKINQQLVHQNEEILQQRNQLEMLAERARADTEAKLRFFTNFSHELRTPLTLILGPVEELLTSSPDLTEPQRHDLALVRRNTQRLLQLVNQLLDFRKIEVGKMEVRATESNLVAFVREIVDAFEKPARMRGVDLRFQVAQPVLLAWFDGNILDKVFFNLLSNALKFTPDQGRITISLQPADEGRSVRVSVADTGHGISPQDQGHIFEWFYQGEQGAVAKGSGMGLALAQGLVRLHQGQLTFSSQPGQGSTFVVTLPRELPEPLRAHGPTAPLQLSLDEPEPIASALGHPLEEAAAETPSETLVLVIEDNSEVNDFLTRKLRTDFRVQSATDGHTGFRMATELIPDLIVCDVMMPGLSGLEVVTQLRADWRTSHIPVVLLTARTTSEQQLEGVQAGADLYLTKPFNPTFLLESIRTLLANRARQREHFRRELSIDTATVAPTNPDQKFLADLTAIVEANLTRSDLSVEDIARSLGISRMQLYRKVKAVLGTGVTDFVQSLRLTKARELLLDETLTIAEVAYELGFSSPSYFSASFKAHYQLAPSEFRNLHIAPQY
ncbi:monosaccharide ABC transporter substrate-binding protein, CUT2 family [Hymenobacter gelipurpurascens]|uniref:histidine kinase n=1 Tax=Hymenobacter gelipurpurascens TaxID=89968 RepID=A0A212UHK1_9BACT|nr:substrate-binding domain-containing protein [Hymenobacter gelipurpurascens]SNC77666.1 monosaccharide ABC transporter substrate-binding protein, CUT2 family [Hymenobacter gelipurpurascens]